MQVDFYHLTRSPIDRVLPQIAGRLLAQDARLLVVASDESTRNRLDASLWTWSAESFLPHGQAGRADDSLQPVLIAGDVTSANGARNIAIVDGEWRDAALGFDRAFHFFSEESIVAARAAWKGLAGRDGVERRYWRQTESGWEQAA
ncbi:DNA polymerase III subunit chi [Stakelama tenebrarum]|uniref:DNA polymerase III subunit chi n=1 Tax=Stakelama tenebrarum TaxID=2711215 RepID=A0A6G6Y6L0_9SPHN|nr:DNA polymerase III subunit chi [Sphingosinithalassobacter tenebrarum]QIG80555.1 DNA polymerase III subunit chi [Sphingosinithalassobacter tenebrarum]